MMIEPLFGSSVPMWTAAPSMGIGFQPPMVTGSEVLSTPLFGPRPVGVVGGAPAVVGISAGPQAIPAPATAAYSQVPAFGTAFPFPPDPSAALVGAITGLVSAPSLLAAVAMRRGQPQGPTNDLEVEDFIYDAADLLPGAGDVEVRCESGRATLTGTVQQKRVKRDIGEIAWAIPAIQDVQNNVTIASRRRARPTPASREAETPAAASRKQG